jgi:CheY-like chemotaxis protein
MTCTLIIADDNVDLALVFEKVARRSGWNVTLCANGKELVRAAGESSGPRLLLVDVNMPEMDGIEVIGSLPVDPARGPLRLRFITGGHEISAVAAHRIAKGRGLDCGPNLYKPVDLAVFAAMLAEERDLLLGADGAGRGRPR